MNLGYILQNKNVNVTLTFHVRVPHGLLAGCMLSKISTLTLKGMVGYIFHLPEMSFWCLCTSQHSSIEWFAFDEYEGTYAYSTLLKTCQKLA